MQLNKTLNYYNQKAKQFIAGTVNVDFTKTQDRFLSRLDSGSYILDFGCGSGRDTKYFMEQGFLVDAIDGSEELCKLASDYTGIQVKNMLFQDLNEKEKYDAIWACSSILHLTKEELRDVLVKMAAALKPEGILYTSFKYGDFQGERNGRFFTDMTVASFAEFIKPIKELEITEQWTTSDVRPGRDEELWLNLILRKVN